ncbi:hypothetical protein BN946_scf184829.g77 [Trametes cinnabarina]|uniref:Glycosyltransferase Family 25 protein n=1 Tax=Pycnoporus cinnabarinus TaxID=5643 RepID=A0A060SEY5_PYCCI|nr:hypothetical protein BN946_scf184829.g77 [Trametes cinnabarina]
MLLTPGKLACWYSHLLAIRRIAEYETGDASVPPAADMRAFMVLEDDVDMEQRLAEILPRVWSALPSNWDIVYLGHCWSDESRYPSIIRDVSSGDAQPVTVHPSFAPLCTHAYALNPRGARRLLRYLTFPPFAYSRALDQALAWLIQSKRVQAFSVVPSLVVQQKETGSDIDQGRNGTGSSWRDELHHVLGFGLVHAPNDSGRDTLVRDILSCDRTELGVLADLYVFGLIRVFYNPNGRTPAVTPALSPRLSLEAATQNPHVLQPSSSNAAVLRSQTLLRHNHRCVFTGIIDAQSYLANIVADVDPGMMALATNVTHIISQSIAENINGVPPAQQAQDGWSND